MFAWYPGVFPGGACNTFFLAPSRPRAGGPSYSTRNNPSVPSPPADGQGHKGSSHTTIATVSPSRGVDVLLALSTARAGLEKEFKRRMQANTYPAQAFVVVFQLTPLPTSLPLVDRGQKSKKVSKKWPTHAEKPHRIRRPPRPKSWI